MRKFISLQEPEKDLLGQVRWDLIQANAKLHLKNTKEAYTFSKSLHRMREKYLKDLHALIGKDNLKKYLKLHNERLEKMKKVRKQLPSTMDGLEKLVKLRKRTVIQSKKLIDDSGVDIGAVQKLQQKYLRSAKNLTGKTISRGESQLSRKKPPKKNQTYRPPYLGFDSECFMDRSRGIVSSSGWTDRLTGEVGSETSIRISDADDSDFAFAACRPRMRIVYTMEEPGPLTLRIELETVHDQVNGSYADECGYSRFDFHQRVWVYVQRTWPAESPRYYCELPVGSYFHYDRVGPIGMLSWIADFSEPGDTHIASLTIPRRPGAVRDEMMGIDIGIETLNYCWVNDVTISGFMRNSYLIREIRLIT